MYQNGKIYRIDCLTTGNVYIGSTKEKTLSLRLSKHKASFKYWNSGKGFHQSSFEVLKNDNYKITLIELFPCNTKDELTSREGYFIRNTDCVNKQVPHRTEKEYYQENKERILERDKEYRNNNKEKVKERQREASRKYREKKRAEATR
jgi:hypothetical protein